MDWLLAASKSGLVQFKNYIDTDQKFQNHCQVSLNHKLFFMFLFFQSVVLQSLHGFSASSKALHCLLTNKHLKQVVQVAML